MSAHDSPGFEIVRAYVVTQLYGDAVIPRFGIETFEFHLLYRLRNTEPTTQAELGRRLLRDPMSVSRLVRAMEQRGLLKRTPSVQDSRAVLVSLTARGEALVTEILGALDDGDPLRGWSEHDRKQLTSLLRRATESMRQACARVGVAAERSDLPPPRTRREVKDDERSTARRHGVARAKSKEPLSRASLRR